MTCFHAAGWLATLGENSALKQGVFQFLIDPAGHPLPLIACDDIGEFAAMALNRPSRYQHLHSDMILDTLLLRTLL